MKTKKKPIDPPRKVVFSNREEYEKRNKAYSDSLDLHNYFSVSPNFLNEKNEGETRGYIKYPSLLSTLEKLNKEKEIFSGTSADAVKSLRESRIVDKNILQRYPNFENMTPEGYYYSIPPKGYSYQNEYGQHSSYFYPQFKKPTVKPVLGAEKTNVPVRDNSPNTTIPKVKKSLPKSIDKIAMDASGTTVYVTVNGKTSAMPKKDYALWRIANKDLYDRYIKNKQQ